MEPEHSGPPALAQESDAPGWGCSVRCLSIRIARKTSWSSRSLQYSTQRHDFVALPYYLEIEATVEQTRQARIAMIARLLLALWEAGLGAVAACDFEEELPQRGGYNPELPRIEP